MKIKDSGISGVLLDIDPDMVSDISSISTTDMGVRRFDYTFRSKVDMRAGAFFNKLRFSLYSRAPEKSSKPTISMLNQTPNGVISELQNEMKKRRIAIGTEFKKFLICQSELDLVSEISNSVVGRIPIVDDSTAFGLRRKSILVTPRSISSHSPLSELSNLEVIFPPSTNTKNNLDIKSNFFKILRSGRDPAEAFLESDLRSRVFTTKERMNGYSRKYQNGLFDQTLDAAARSLRNSFETNFSTIDKVENQSGNSKSQIYQKDDSFSQFSPNDLVPIEIRETNREKIVSTSLTVDETKIPASRKMFLLIEVIDDNNLIQQTRSFLIDHGKNIAIFEMPREAPSIKVKNIGNGEYRIECQTSDQNVNSIAVYAKKINENLISDSSFAQIGSLSLDSVNYRSKGDLNQKEGFVPSGCVEKRKRSSSREYPQKITSFTYSSSTLLPVLFRAVSSGKSGVSLSNFSSSSSSLQKNTPRHASISGRIDRNGINISVSRIPKDVVLVEFLRRDLSRHEREFLPIPILDDVATQESSTIKNSIGSDIITFFDENVFDDHLYEYTVLMIYSNGDRVLSSGRFIDTYKSPSGISEVRITNKTKKSLGKTSNRVTISMNVDLINSEGLFDFILSGLDSYQKSLFSNDISKIKESLGKSSRIEVVRTDQSTGESLIAMIVPGKFTDDGLPFGGRAPTATSDYTYRFEPLIVSPTEILKDMSVSRNIDKNSNLKDPRNRMAASKKADDSKRSYSNDQLSAESSNNKNINYTEKFFSESSLLKGTLDYGRKKSGFDTGRTGDFSYVTVAGSKLIPRITHASARQIILNGVTDIILTWKGVETGLIDYFVIAAEVLGSKVVIGAAHNVSNSGNYTYISRDFRDFTGGVIFHITPILNSGSALTTVLTEKMAVREVEIAN